jgi:hypothetical protein
MRRLLLPLVVVCAAWAPATATAFPATIQNVLNGRCLDAGASLVGTRVTLWQCNASLQQGWNVDITSSGLALRSASSGRCLDADTNTIGLNGTKVQLWDCNGARQQRWTLRSGQIFSRAADQALDADTNTANQDGGIVQLWFPNGAAQQHWRIAPTTASGRGELAALSCSREPRGSGKRIGVRLSVAGSRRARSTLTTTVGRRVRVSGKLVADNGKAIAGGVVRLCVKRRSPGARAKPVATVNTDAHGRYRLALRGGGSSRVWVVTSSDDGVISAAATLRVKGRRTRAGG